jgi:hypothetical protein
MGASATLPCAGSGTAAVFARFLYAFEALAGGVFHSGNLKMDQRDQELLDKQLRSVSPSPRNDGVMILAIVAVFFAGITLGGILFAPENGSTQIASNDAAISVPKGISPSMWQ